MSRPKVSLAVCRVFWRLIAEGLSTEAAALAVGVSRGLGKRWFAEAGGMSPIELDEPSGRYLGPAEREVIALRLAEGRSLAEIARELGRHPSTIGREVRRNRAVGTNVDRGPKYRARLAQHKAEQRARRPKPSKLATCLPLRREVARRLELNHSPEQIARRLPEDFPDEPEMWVSHETIYQSIYVQGRGGLKRELAKHLRTGRALRKPRRRDGERRGRIPDMVMISERPPEVDDRAVPGHWEGDLIVGANSASAIGTLVERMTRFVILLHLPTDHGALAVQEAIVAKMSQLPEILRRTLTWDQGKEMTNHAQISDAAGLDVYFCDPHAPWQRGTNENTNGLLRQYFPKGTDLSVHGPGYLDLVADEMNNRPRKTLDWRTPAEALDHLLSEPLNPRGVATTG